MTGLVTTVTLKDLNIDVLAGTSGGPALFGQRIPDASDISLSFLSDNLFSIYKGESAIILTSAQLAAEYSGSIIVGELSVEYNETLATWTVYRDSNVISSGPLTPAPAYVPAGSLVWIGGTPLNNNPADITANPISKAKDHWRIGNVEVDVDGTKILDFIMPSGTATNIPDIVGNNDGTLREGTGDGSDWGQILSAENTSSASTTETGQVLGGLMPGNNVSSPSTNELAVMSTALISGLDSKSASSSEFGSMVSQIIFGSSEISGSSYQIGTMTTNGLISGLNVRSGSTTEEGLLVTAIINASDSVSISSTQQGIMNTALISGLNSISASNTEIGILTTVKYNSNRIMVIGA